MSNILILGLGKTGTTALYDRIKQAVAADSPRPYFLFEPVRPEPFEALRVLAPERPIVTKVMLHRAESCRLDFDQFDYRVMSVRDPRDVIVSRLLFRPLIRSSMAAADDGRLDRLLEAIRRKEAEPRSISVRELCELADELKIGSTALRSFSESLVQQVEIDRSHPFHASRYEDFVAGDVAALSAYLGRELESANRETSGWLGHIARSMGTGEWRHWFTVEDVEYFRPLLDPFTQHYGYDDWDLASEAVIDPINASAYIERKLVDRRTQVAARYESAADAELHSEDLEPLRTMAEDGDPGACVRLANVYSNSSSPLFNMAEAERYARHAAIQGSTPAARLLAQWSDDSTRRYWSIVADVWRGRKRDDGVLDGKTIEEWRAEAASLRRRLKRREKSIEFRSGTALVDAVRSPGRNTIALPVRLWRLARERRRTA